MASTDQAEWKTLLDVIDLLESQGIAYMLTGSLAKTFYATPRMTRDIDIVVELDHSNIGAIVKAFEKSYYIDRDLVEQALSHSSLFNVLHNLHHVKVDLIIRKDETYRKLEFQRRKKFSLGGKNAWVVSPEDLILSKLIWAKDSHSAVQIADIEDLFSSVKNLDLTYIEEWVAKLGLREILAKVNR